jgi:hypothetical protein
MSTTISGIALFSSDSFTRPANTTTYASGELVANSATAGSVVPLSYPTVTTPGGIARIDAVRIRKSGTTTTNALFRVHLYNTIPTVASGDNAAFSTSGSGTYIGAYDVSVDRAFTDGACGRGVALSTAPIEFITNNGTLYAAVEARGAYTPASGEVFEIIIEGYRF